MLLKCGIYYLRKLLKINVIIFINVAMILILKPKIGLMLSHYPLHPSSLSTIPFNVHGHIHERRVMLDEVKEDMRYICVSVENTNYEPVLLDNIVELVEMRRGVLMA